MHSRRSFFSKFGAASGLALGAMACGGNEENTDDQAALPACELSDAVDSSSLSGDPLATGGHDFGGEIGAPVERTAVATACWQCVSRDGAIGYVEDGRLMKLEGNPKLPRTNGKLCARGQGGANQVYDPDRLLSPMISPTFKAWLDGDFPNNRPTADRGTATGEWIALTWAEAQGYLTKVLKRLLDEGTPEQFFFHYGRMKASSSKILKSYLLPTFGTGSLVGHTSICESAKWTAQELTWGKHYDVNDLANANIVVNFGSNPYVAHTSHIPFSQRLSSAKHGGAELHTFDVRLSETAARSTKWYPIRPGSDLAIILALSHELVTKHSSALDTDFINNWCYAGKYHQDVYTGADNVAILTAWLSGEGYTAAWAEARSGVPRADIEALATKLAGNSPASVLTYRGAVTHWNGVQTERAAQMLQALLGGINKAGGRVRAVGAKWSNTYKTPSSGSKLSILDGGYDGYVDEVMGTSKYLKPSHHADHQVFNTMLGSGIFPKLYMAYCYAPVFANGDCNQSSAVLRDRSKIEAVITVSTTFSETCELSDMVIPDATYLERWDWEDMVSFDHLHEYYLRQPVVDPVMGVRDFKDFFRDVIADAPTANPPGLGLKLPDGADFWTDSEAFVKDAINNTSALAGLSPTPEAYMLENGAWHDADETPVYEAHTATTGRDNVFDGATLIASDVGGDAEKIIVFTPDDPSLPSYSSAETTGNDVPASTIPGVFWNLSKTKASWDPASTEAPPSYYGAKNGYKGYVGRGAFGGSSTATEPLYVGFTPDKVELSGLFEIYSMYVDAHLPGYIDGGGNSDIANGWVWPNWMEIPNFDKVTGSGDPRTMILTHYKDRAHTHSRTQNCKVLSELMHDNPAWINAATAEALGISEGDRIRITNSDMRFPDGAGGYTTKSESVEANVRITEGVHPDVISMAHHVGHWQHGRYATAGTVTAPLGRDAATDADIERIWWTDKGTRVNFVMPNYGDPIGGMQRYGDTIVTVTKV